jgi:hypothetical protein
MLRAHNAAELFETTMIFFNAPQTQGFVRTTLDGHRQVTGRSEFSAAVWSRDLEDFDRVVTFQMNDQAMARNHYVANGLIARVSRSRQRRACNSLPHQRGCFALFARNSHASTIETHTALIYADSGGRSSSDFARLGAERGSVRH